MIRKSVALNLILTSLMLLAIGFLFTNLSSANFFPEPGPDLPRIYIRSDGNVEPATVPIERTGNLYKMTGNIVLHTVEIQRDNIILDGAGYAIQGNESRIKGYDDGNNGIIVTRQENVSITHVNFEKGDTGIRISGCVNISVVDNSFSNGIRTGLEVQDSIFVLIEANSFTDLNTDLHVPAVVVDGSNNTFKDNKLIGSTYGITIHGSSTTISDNKIEAVLPIILENASSNTIKNNIITGTTRSITFSEQKYTGNEGIALFVNCSKNVIIGNNITGFANQAIRIAFNGLNNTIYNNYFANNKFAIAMGGWSNTVPIYNLFYGNTFAQDSCNIQINQRDCNLWDNGTIGNYWGNYNGTDNNGDGIGDTPYTVNGFKWDNYAEGFVSFAANHDNYPLMVPLESIMLPTPLQQPNPQEEPFPALPTATASFISTTIASLGLLVYLKKRNEGKNK